MNLTLLLAYRLFKELEIHLIAHRLHVTVLLCAEHIARSPEFKVAHRYLEAGAELGIFPYRVKSVCRNLRELFSRTEGKICARAPR